MNWKRYLHYLLASCFYLGSVPFCPGSVASLAAVILFFVLPPFPLYFELLFVAVGIPLSVWISELGAEQSTQRDPSWIVIDEFIGMYVAVIGLPKIWWVYCIAFFAFRFFDISKIFPINFVCSW
jgi:phosphatidylglycerophosphatase A